MRATAEVRELGAAEFTANLGALVAVYAAAMKASPLVLPARHEIMARHAGHEAFRAVIARAGQAGHASAAGPPPALPGGAEPGEPSTPASAAGPIIAFAYGFRGSPGQWWYDLVRSALVGQAGARAAGEWLADCLEIAEVHVHPDHQRHGLGRRMLLRLTAGRPERTALLSTMDADTTARRLYLRLGFGDLLRDFRFPGADEPYAVMGAELPLATAATPGAA